MNQQWFFPYSHVMNPLTGKTHAEIKSTGRFSTTPMVTRYDWSFTVMIMSAFSYKYLSPCSHTFVCLPYFILEIFFWTLHPRSAQALQAFLNRVLFTKINIFFPTLTMKKKMLF